MTSQEEIDASLKEVLPFLDVLTPTDYKTQILEYVLGMTGTSQGVIDLSKNTKLVERLIDLSEYDKTDTIKQESLRIIVNLSSTCGVMTRYVLNTDYVYYLLNVIVQKDCSFSDLAAMLLTNASQDTSHCQTVVDVLKDHDNVTVKGLVDVFCTTNYNAQCDVPHLGSFLSNLTSVKEVRTQLFNEEKLFERILPFTQFEGSKVRRHAAATIIKNCLFETEHHERLIDEADILVHLVLPLAGPEELDDDENDKLPLDLQYMSPDKQREPSREIQQLLVESLFQLCSNKSCRVKLKDSGVYYYMRELHKHVHPDDPFMIPLENFVQALIGDEPRNSEHDNLREIEIPQDVQVKLNSMLET